MLTKILVAILQKRRPPSFFNNLHLTLQILKNFFRKTDEENSNSKLKQVEHKLRLHGLETGELIHQFHLERFKEQEELEDADLGVITVRAQFLENLLKVEVMNARNLHPKDSNGKRHNFVNKIFKIF